MRGLARSNKAVERLVASTTALIGNGITGEQLFTVLMKQAARETLTPLEMVFLENSIALAIQVATLRLQLFAKDTKTVSVFCNN